MNKTGWVYSDKYLKHRTRMHPERKERLGAIVDHLTDIGLMNTLMPIEPYPADVGQISRIHTLEHIDFIRESCKQGIGALDPDTRICSDSYEVALLAVGGSAGRH